MFTVKKAAAIAASVAIALGLGACSAHPGSAFVLNGVSYSESDLAAASAQYNAMTGGTLVSSSLVPTLVNVETIDAAAQMIGITVSDQDVDLYFASLVEQGRIQAPEEGELTPVMREIIRSTLVQQLLGQLNEPQREAMTEAYAQLKDTMELEVNPRYASMDAEGQTLTPLFGDVVQANKSTQTLLNGGGAPRPQN